MIPGDSQTEYLFSNVDIFGVMEAQRRHALSEIGNIDPDRLLSTNTEELTDYITGKYRLDVPSILRKQALLEEPRKFTTEVNDYGMEHETRVTQFTLTVPFDGDGGMFRVQPTTFDSAPPLLQTFGTMCS
jgi:hypothetical protein